MASHEQQNSIVLNGDFYYIDSSTAYRKYPNINMECKQPLSLLQPYSICQELLEINQTQYQDLQIERDNHTMNFYLNERQETSLNYQPLKFSRRELNLVQDDPSKLGDTFSPYKDLESLQGNKLKNTDLRKRSLDQQSYSVSDIQANSTSDRQVNSTSDIQMNSASNIQVNSQHKVMSQKNEIQSQPKSKINLSQSNYWPTDNKNRVAGTQQDTNSRVILSQPTTSRAEKARINPMPTDSRITVNQQTGTHSPYFSAHDVKSKKEEQQKPKCLQIYKFATHSQIGVNTDYDQFFNNEIMMPHRDQDRRYLRHNPNRIMGNPEDSERKTNKDYSHQNYPYKQEYSEIRKRNTKRDEYSFESEIMAGQRPYIQAYSKHQDKGLQRNQGQPYSSLGQINSKSLDIMYGHKKGQSQVRGRGCKLSGFNQLSQPLVRSSILGAEKLNGRKSHNSKTLKSLKTFGDQEINNQDPLDVESIDQVFNSKIGYASKGVQMSQSQLTRKQKHEAKDKLAAHLQTYCRKNILTQNCEQQQQEYLETEKRTMKRKDRQRRYEQQSENYNQSQQNETQFHEEPFDQLIGQIKRLNLHVGKLKKKEKNRQQILKRKQQIEQQRQLIKLMMENNRIKTVNQIQNKMGQDGKVSYNFMLSILTMFVIFGMVMAGLNRQRVCH